MSEKGKTQDRSRDLNLFIALLGILAPASYLIGLSFHQGSLSAYGINPEVLPFSIQDSYITAYYAVSCFLSGLSKIIINFLNSIFSAPGVFIFIGVVLLSSLLWHCFNKLKPVDKICCFCKRFQTIGRIIEYFHWDNNGYIRTLFLTSSMSYVLITTSLFFVSISFFWFAIPYYAYQKGSSVAEKNRDDFISKGCYVKKGDIFSNCKTLISSDGEVVYRGLLVFQTKDMVAFFTNTGSYVSAIPKGAVVHSTLEKKDKSNKLKSSTKKIVEGKVLGENQGCVN
ncbi:hypothetical protein Pcar_0987 [Syntrophotalea carbinolica DSM 2380]|uniref:Uncharacterized protein n=1 Tax=Syntrophotalea carbinolica (strain DSM 2380 / NBRC 103641 / GraBd1) TaxID=338963 RepID=Q3A5W7_SYNC1|nr:hypothetical protein [Syntrophotalea carbinolica]ABA88240.2 hypothetical protein Pcar_0987 [Syntrophotalea carbinolica DSM 2380]